MSTFIRAASFISSCSKRSSRKSEGKVYSGSSRMSIPNLKEEIGFIGTMELESLCLLMWKETVPVLLEIAALTIVYAEFREYFFFNPSAKSGSASTSQTRLGRK